MNRRNSPRKSGRWPIVLLALLLLAGVVYTLFIKSDETVETDQNSQQNEQTTGPTEQTGWRPAAGSYQQVVEEFASTHKGTYSIVITNPADGMVLADYQGDTEYFTASIYKLYIAYEGYRKIDDGTFSLNDPYLSGYTRGECLDAMIRDSYSPCAEKMWVELGKETLTEAMENLGLTNTSLVGLSTSAKDASMILERIDRGEGLSPVSRAAFLDSMKTQDALYRRGLPSGFSSGVTVYNKVGWNELIEWHDTAIVDFGNDKKLVVSVLTKNAGMANLKELAATIQSNLPN